VPPDGDLRTEPVDACPGLDVRTDHVTGGVRSLPVTW
jgi:hypothetical protein